MADQVSSWELLARRAMGEQVSAEEMLEARRRARGPQPAWAEQVAERAMGQSGQAAAVERGPLTEFEERLRRRLGAPADGGTDDAA